MDTYKKVYKFLKKYKLLIAIIVFFCIVARLTNFYNYKFSRSAITALISRSIFAGNAVFINKTQLLTTASLVEDICNYNEYSRTSIYVIDSKTYYKVDVAAINRGYNLALLELQPVYSRRANIKNYSILSTEDLLHKTNVYYYTNNNEPFKTFIHQGKVILENTNTRLKLPAMTRVDEGGPVLDKNLSLVGLLGPNTPDLRPNIIGRNLIEKFLIENHVDFRINSNKIALQGVRNYHNELNTQVICITKPLSIRRTFIINGVF